MRAVALGGGRYASGSPSLAPERLNEAADILYPPSRYSRSELDRLRKCTRLHLPPEGRGGKREDRGNELRLPNVTCFRQRAEGVAVRIV
jgi:hypothetical protein